MRICRDSGDYNRPFKESRSNWRNENAEQAEKCPVRCGMLERTRSECRNSRFQEVVDKEIDFRVVQSHIWAFSSKRSPCTFDGVYLCSVYMFKEGIRYSTLNQLYSQLLFGSNFTKYSTPHISFTTTF